MITLWILSFIAWVLTILAPCVLPLLPVIIWGWLSTNKWYRPLIITFSLAASLIIFTLLLKSSLYYFNVDQQYITYLSWSILLLLGLFMLLPDIWSSISLKLWFEKSNKLISKTKKIWWIWGDILLWAVLWPVFSSCSPTFALIISLVLPVDFTQWIINLSIYSFALSATLLAISYLWRYAIQKLNWIANPNWFFKKAIAIIIIIVSGFILSGYDKVIEKSILDSWFWDVTKIESNILQLVDIKKQVYRDVQTYSTTESDLFNVNYKAPWLQWITWWINWSWINSFSELSWKVLLIDFWTYSCINCIRTIPYINNWHNTYQKDWLVVIWLHAPEFTFEKDPNNVNQAIKKFWINYLVWLDNNFQTWRNFNNLYWPATYIIDKDGIVRYEHFGEWNYDRTEKVIQKLLYGNSLSSLTVIGDKAPDFQNVLTSEAYLWTNRIKTYNEWWKYDPVFINSQWFNDTNFTKPTSTNNPNTWFLEWWWKFNSEYLESVHSGSITLNFSSKIVNLVWWSDSKVPTKVKVLLNWFPISKKDAGKDVQNWILIISEKRLYEVVNQEEYMSWKVELIFEDWSANLYTRTFG